MSRWEIIYRLPFRLDSLLSQAPASLACRFQADDLSVVRGDGLGRVYERAMDPKNHKRFCSPLPQAQIYHYMIYGSFPNLVGEAFPYSSKFRFELLSHRSPGHGTECRATDATTTTPTMKSVAIHSLESPGSSAVAKAMAGQADPSYNIRCFCRAGR